MLTFFDKSFNLFLTSIFVLFEVTFSFKFFNLSSKPVFYTILAISLLLAKFACSNLAVKLSAVNLSNY